MRCPHPRTTQVGREVKRQIESLFFVHTKVNRVVKDTCVVCGTARVYHVTAARHRGRLGVVLKF